MAHTADTDFIDHTGIVMAVDSKGGTMKVKLDNAGDCGDCPANKICEATGQTENTVTVTIPNGAAYKKGDIVTLRGTERLHHKAVMYATVLPCIALVAVMVAVYVVTFNQLAAALSGIGVTIVFYIGLWLCRNKIAHEFSFTIV